MKRELKSTFMKNAEEINNLNSKNYLETWKSSSAYKKISEVCEKLIESIKSSPRTKNKPKNKNITKILEIFNKIVTLMDEIEVDNENMFNHSGFKKWIENIEKIKSSLFDGILDSEEAIYYFLNSFGNASRGDFGTGHEFNFLAFVVCLFELGIVNDDDLQDIFFCLFWEYWNCFISIQNKFHLPPAGSSGSWGIDDFVILPFVFGSSQLIGNNIITPKNVLDKDVSTKYKDTYSYCKWIAYLYDSKKGNLEINSNILWSLSRISDFQKINKGMVNLFYGEVMNKYVIFQHLKFGELLKLESQ